ncbi:hypothetical protein EHR04_01330 [Leptospira levettii]|uniref:hypothetical protein n=1 Tax=Leptospira levettii TaxID=2023178 RepID=UPI001091A3F6|nr:hypothetical protein [Leptospira levettii]TGM78438.1 hypothetical protein EHR04_01330 [Leptospira levettii]
MRIYFFVLFIFLFSLLSPISAEGTMEKQDPITELLLTLSEVVFSDPFQKEEIEIRKRLLETNQSEIRNLRIRLKHTLRNRTIQKESFVEKKGIPSEWENDLEQLGNLGGFLWKDDRGTIYQWGDWSDFYEDGFSKNKIRLEGQIPSFPYEGGTIYFFIRNPPGSFPIHFDFIGWETSFYAFGDEGSLRYTNDFALDPSERLGEFRKNFDAIRKKIPGSLLFQANDLTIFLVPGKPRPIYFVFLFLRILLVVWTILLFLYIVRMSFSFPKNQLPEDRVHLS